MKILLSTVLLGAGGDGRHLGTIVVQLEEVGREELEKGKGLGDSLEIQGTCSSLLPSFPAWIGELHLRHEGRRGKRWCAGAFGPEQVEPAQGEEREDATTEVGLGVYHPPHLPCPHPGIHPALDGACANKRHSVPTDNHGLWRGGKISEKWKRSSRPGPSLKSG